jgi:hypothetical protein
MSIGAWMLFYLRRERHLSLHHEDHASAAWPQSAIALAIENLDRSA